ncbi:MAG: hypothetical protein WDM76_14575 [Limisphaerales bacterium]
MNSYRAISSALVIGSLDAKFSETETRKLLESLGGAHIELVEED